MKQYKDKQSLPLRGKKILIFGLGLNQGGVGSAKFFAMQGAQVKVTDLKSADILKPSIDQLRDFPDITFTLGEHKFEDINWADLIIKNPAVKPGNPYIEYAIKIGKKVEMDMGIFLQFVKPSQIIGITGTKGKSTTATLIYEILKADGKNVILTGNIGKSVLGSISHIKKDTIVVLEVSSFQLEAFDQHKVSPKWAIVTNIYEDHLNYYENMDEYIAAKRVIGKYQTNDDFLFINKDDPKINNPQFLEDFKGKIIFYSSADLPQDFAPHLMGEHNKSNMAAALAVGKTFGIDEKSTLEVLQNFKGIPFRMELINEWHGVKIINDTTATGPDAGIQALETASHMTSGNVVLICGGMNKGMDYTQFVTIVKKCVKKVFFLEGDSSDEILMSLQAESKNSTRRGKLTIHGPYNNLEKLLEDVKSEVKKGDVILFSPAATSFNLFQNEFDRGRKFNGAVNKIFK